MTHQRRCLHVTPVRDVDALGDVVVVVSPVRLHFTRF